MNLREAEPTRCQTRTRFDTSFVAQRSGIDALPFSPRPLRPDNSSRARVVACVSWQAPTGIVAPVGAFSCSVDAGPAFGHQSDDEHLHDAGNERSGECGGGVAWRIVLDASVRSCCGKLDQYESSNLDLATEEPDVGFRSPACKSFLPGGCHLTTDTYDFSSRSAKQDILG